MRCVTFILAFLLCASPASAQFTAATSGGVVGAPQAIPAVPCVNGVGVLGGGWNLCNSIQQWVELYNEGVKIQNQLNEIQQNVYRYARYPQSLAGNAQADLTAIEGIVDQVNGLSVMDSNVASTISRIFPRYQSGVPYSTLNTQLAQSTNTSITNALQTLGYNVNTLSRDANNVEAIKAAAASATSPIETTQLLAQISAIMVEQMQKQQQISGAGLNAAASYYLSQTQRQQALSTSENQAIQAWQKFANVQIPTLTDSQIQQILGQ
jgi:P-type conjugative transfer protein TrbJ